MKHARKNMPTVHAVITKHEESRLKKAAKDTQLSRAACLRIALSQWLSARGF